MSSPFSITAFSNGDEQAFRQVYDLYYTLLYLYALKILDDKPEAQDIALDSMVKLSLRRTGFETLEKIKAFLYTATRNACLDMLKTRRTKYGALKKLNYLLTCTEQTDPLLADAGIIGELNRQIETLPLIRKEVFKLLYFNQLTIFQVAQTLNMSPGNVRQHKSLAIKDLHSALLKKGLLD